MDNVIVVSVEDQDMDFSNGVRKQLIGKIIEKGIPVDDTKQCGILLQALDGIDRQALGKKRIKVEEDAGKSAAGMASAIADLLRQQQTGITASQAPVGSKPPPMLGSEVPPPVLIEGETSVVASQLDYDSFTSKMIPPEE